MPDAVRVLPRAPSPETALLARELERLRAEESLAAGVAAGVAAAVLTAFVQAGLTALFGYPIGYFAIAGIPLVGSSVQRAGKGIGPVFAWAGALLSLFGCLLGHLLAITVLRAQRTGAPFLDILLDLNPARISDLMRATVGAVDLLFYGLAIGCGFRESCRRSFRPTLEEIHLAGSAPVPCPGCGKPFSMPVGVTIHPSARTIWGLGGLRGATFERHLGCLSCAKFFSVRQETG